MLLCPKNLTFYSLLSLLRRYPWCSAGSCSAVMRNKDFDKTAPSLSVSLSGNNYFPKQTTPLKALFPSRATCASRFPRFRLCSPKITPVLRASWTADIPNGQESATLVWVANHSTGFGSPCPLTDLAI